MCVREHDFSNKCMVLNGFLRVCKRKDMSFLLLEKFPKREVSGNLLPLEDDGRGCLWGRGERVG